MYKDILLPVDLDQEESWKKALPTAIEYCKAFGARLHVMTVMPDFGLPMVATYFPKNFEHKAIEEANKHLHDFVSQQVPKEVPVQHIVAEGRVYKEIIRVAGEINADLILMASHRPELRDYFIGPNAEHVIRHASQSVLVVRG